MEILKCGWYIVSRCCNWNHIEIVAHLFFHCRFVAKVWYWLS